MKPFTQDIYDAMGREIERIEGQRGAWGGHDSERVELCRKWRAEIESGKKTLVLRIEDTAAPIWPLRL